MTPGTGPQRIGHILPFTAVGGTEIGTARIIGLTRSPELEHVVFYPAGAHVVARWLAEQGLRGVPYDPPEPSLFRQLPRFLQASRVLARQLRQEALTVVHCADLLAAHHCGLAAWLARYPILCHVRGRYPDITTRGCLFIRPVDRFVFVSQDSRTAFGCRAAARRGQVVHDGISLPAAGNPAAARRALGIPEDRIVIGMVARIAPPKDQLLLVAAAEGVLREHPRCQLVFIGSANPDRDGEARRRHLEADIAARGLTGQVTLTGHRDDVATLLPGLDILALVSAHEGLPLVLLEAMAQGLPVVASRVGGIPELVTDGTSGLLHRAGDAGDLAAQLRALVTDPVRRGAMGQAGRDRVAREFSSARFAETMRRVYKELAPGSAREGPLSLPWNA